MIRGIQLSLLPDAAPDPIVDSPSDPISDALAVLSQWRGDMRGDSWELYRTTGFGVATVYPDGEIRHGPDATQEEIEAMRVLHVAGKLGRLGGKE